MLGPADHLHALRHEGGHFVGVLEDADPATPVPTCPGWHLARLGRHLGWIYDNVRRVVEEGRTAIPTDQAEPPPNDALAGWVRVALHRLLDVLGARAADEPCWTWAGERRVGFWCRRMAAETAVHRFDAEHAVRGPHGASPIAPALAADALDELLVVLLPELPETEALPGALALRCTDADGAWVLRSENGRTRALAGAGPADALVVGPASNLLLVTIGRLPPTVVEVTGDEGVLGAWLAAPRF